MSSEDQTLDCAIIVDGLPVVDDSKYDKLVSFVKKKFSAFGTIVDIDMPKGEDQKTHGFMFILYDTPTAAKASLELDRKPMDKSNIFRVSFFKDFENYQDVDEEYSVPDVSSIMKAKPDLNAWLLDPQLRDQFAVRYLDEGVSQTAIYWDDRFTGDKYLRTVENDGHEHLEVGKTWTDNAIQWSSTGQFFATFHEPGIALWGGEKWERIHRFTHDKVSGISFSPCDRYVLTYSVDSHNNKALYKLWDASLGSLLRIFDDVSADEASPALKWSFDGSYLARFVKSQDKTKVLGISVYVAPTFQQLDNKLIAAPNACELSWSPVENVLCYTIPGNPNVPAAVNLMAIPSRQVLRSKHIFSMIDIKTFWQASGEYLAVYTSRRKTKKTEKHTIEIICVKAKDMPVHELEVESAPLCLAFDPLNPVFGAVFEIANARNKDLKLAEANFYRVTATTIKPMGKYAYPNSPGCTAESTKLFFSPAGKVCIIAAVQPATSFIQFVDVSADQVSLISNAQGVEEHSHHKCSDVIWEPSGRHVATISSRPLAINEHNSNLRTRDQDSYMLWTYHGNKVVDVPVNNLFMFLWRPRPPTTLSSEKVADVKKNLKTTYWKQFEADEDKARLAKKSEATRDRLRIKTDWKNFRDEAAQWVQAEHSSTIYDESRDLVEVEQMVWVLSSTTTGSYDESA